MPKDDEERARYFEDIEVHEGHQRRVGGTRRALLEEDQMALSEDDWRRLEQENDSPILPSPSQHDEGMEDRVKQLDERLQVFEVRLDYVIKAGTAFIHHYWHL